MSECRPSTRMMTAGAGAAATAAVDTVGGGEGCRWRFSNRKGNLDMGRCQGGET